jgi:transcriptional regulator with XRE-family HTH domain
MSFKDNLKSELVYQDMLVKELAAITGISRHTLDNYLNVREQMPTADNAVKIAQALGVSVEYLVLGEENKQENSSLSSEVRVLIQNYKQLNDDDKKMIIAITQLYKNKKRRD